jgi:hypothetical protein
VPGKITAGKQVHLIGQGDHTTRKDEHGNRDTL